MENLCRESGKRRHTSWVCRYILLAFVEVGSSRVCVHERMSHARVPYVLKSGVLLRAFILIVCHLTQ